ncbi:ROK family protein [Bacteroides pyogenes]|uniref:ROK family protein n=1 Tax=Bacteroides pyogenes TaxID=310300 RepID=UPI0011E40B30|nr:ROK family protein [Bacteroides pyogenes]MBR8707995.1 Glucokinase [Bacteroides pyogenes]MBR8716898.1 Glucokinase [Bacteroides pyogenes]MBR8746428.1 Glucokinase [Bacteroides pyogenes]MBR8756700.1 Glucokinase [Bacteroides pyogenes]MBR8779864.1 Glucokinase [Bacteroides pyogenes]
MKKRYAIGIDLGGTSIKYALIDNKGTVLFQNKLASKAEVSAEAVIGQLVKAVKEAKEFAAGQGYTVEGVGIGTPGIVDASNRIVLGGSDNIEGWVNVPLADRIEAETELPAVLENDANAMGLGETMYGAGRGATHIVFLTVGTGIGGAVVIGGKLFNGFANRGTELGHIPLIHNGEPCTCGSVGCLEQYASASALIRRFKKRIAAANITCPAEEINGELIVRLYRQGDPTAIESLEEHFDFLGRGIAGLINIFSPQKVVIGGGLSEAGDFYIRKVSEKAHRYAMPDCDINTEITAASLGNRAGSIGAASLALMRFSESNAL